MPNSPPPPLRLEHPIAFHKSDTIDVKKLVWNFVIIFPPNLLIVHKRKNVSILLCVYFFYGTSKVFPLNPCYGLLWCYSTCVITFADDKLAICNLSWLRIMWSHCVTQIFILTALQFMSFVLCCYYVYFDSSIFQVPSIHVSSIPDKGECSTREISCQDVLQ